MKKLFGGLNLNWPKIIIFAIIIGLYTGIIAMIPAVRYTSLITITATFEVWILFGILIIMNAKSNKDSALKCFVFFLISQPLVYLIQDVINGSSLFLTYYKFWVGWTIACLPMGYIGYYMKKDKWWGIFILMPMILFTILEFDYYLCEFLFNYPFYIAICLFCIIMPFVYIFGIFSNKKVRIISSIISAILIAVIIGIEVPKPHTYHTQVLGTVNGKEITPEYKVSLKDSKYGDVSIKEEKSGDEVFYMVDCDFKRPGTTELIVETPEGETVVYNLDIKRNTYKLERK
jgi:hypothetical protein